MVGLLLEVNGTDLVFGVKDMITLIIGIVGVSTAFITLQLNFKSFKDSVKVKFETMEKEYDKEVEALKIEDTGAKMGRHSIRKEVTQLVNDKFDVANLRIDKTQEDFKAHKTEVQSEFKEINMNLNKIVGMLEAQQKK